ncbi:MAG: response regulator [Desulfomonilaceae bacterium]|jgi:PAS domain S-box-containing protein
MTQHFITSQVDYAFFVSGLAFIILAVICGVLAQAGRDRLPFVWMTVFAATHGLSSLLETLALSATDLFLFKVIRLALMAGSYIALFEFGRLSRLIQTKNNEIGPWIYYPLIFLSAIGALEGVKGAFATCGYFLGISSSVLASMVLWRESNDNLSKESRQLKIAAVSMLVYGLATGLFPAESTFFPAASLNQEWFWRTFGFPVQLIRAACAVIMAVGIWRFFLHRWVSTQDFSLEPTETLGGRWLAFSLTLTILAGWGATGLVGARADRNERENLLVQAGMVAGGVASDQLERLTGSVSDLDSSDYKAVHERFEMMKKGNPLCRFLYLLGWKDGLVVFLMDSEPIGSKDFSPPGYVYDDAPPAIKKIFETGKEITDGPYTDKWGSWISAFVPLSGPNTDGKVMAVLGIDVSSSLWAKSIATSRLLPILFTLITVMLIIGFFAIELKHKESELEIRASEARLRIVFNSAHDALIIQDATGRVINFNSMMLDLFNYTPDQIMSTTIERDLPGPASPLDTMPEVWRKTLDGENQIIEWEARRSDGSFFHAEVILKKFEDGATNLVLTSIRDISERKSSEEALRKANSEVEETNQRLRSSIKEAQKLTVEAQAANIAKSQFLANVSHEIRTPLNGVIGMTELLLDTKLDEKQKEYSDIIKIGGDSLLTLINDILDFSKIEAGKLALENIDFDLRATLEDISDLLAMRAQEKDLELVCLIDPEVPSFVIGDPGRLRQILTNIIGNAIKFTPHGEVSVNVFVLGELESKTILKFTVTDTGIGIPADKVEQLFDPFTQIDSSDTRQYGGTGLGLSISKNLVELMGGEIGVESGIDNGSIFWFTAVLEQQPFAPPKHVSPREEICGRRILGVDDNATNRRLLEAYLQTWGCGFDLVDGGPSALIKLRHASLTGDPYEIVLLDMQMPGMDGETLGEIIKGDPDLSDLILIMMTSLSRRGDAKRLQEKGFAGYLTKPVRQAQLYDCLVMSLGQACGPISGENRRIVTRHTIAEARRKRLRVLVVEDNYTNQKLALSVLEKMGHDAQCANDGGQALDILKKEKFDIVLMDVQMPIMDGLQATRIIRESVDEILDPDARIIAMTAHAMKGDRERCIEAGMNDYISKPVQARDLAEILERWSGSNGNGNGKKKNLAPDSHRPNDLNSISSSYGITEMAPDSV